MQIEKICRACLREDDKMIDISEKDVYQKFLLFANITARDVLYIPLNLCQSCEQKLNISLDFKEECQKSHEILLNYIKNTRDVKLEATANDVLNAKKQSRIELFSQYEVLEAIKDLKHNFYENKNCIRCSYFGNNARALSLHVSLVHKDLKPRWCYTCNGEFDNLTEHLATNHKEDYTCKFCSRKFQSIGRLTEHLRNHSDIKSFQCMFCERSFSRQCHLSAHLRKHSKMQDGGGDADKQPTVFKLEEHTNKVLHKCMYCEKKFKSQDHMIKHELTHPGQRHICQVCGKRFAQSDTLKTHMMLHTGPKISCKMCNKKFSRPLQLRLHLRRHTGEKPYVCTECGKGFIRSSHLAEHNKTHSDLRPYQCNYCHKCFKTKILLKRHIVSHSGEKPYKCNQCSYACRHSGNLTKHMKRHVVDKPRADKPHVCLMCNSSFTTDAMLTSHINTHNVSFLDI